MMPILYGEFETKFNTNGIGILRDAIECEVLQVLNGEYELEMVYPLKGIHFKEITQRSIILAKPDPATKAQPFRVYRITKPMKGKVTVYARHIAYDMMGIPVAPFSAEGIMAALSALKEHAVGECSFEFHTDKTTSSTMTVKVPTAMWNLLGGTEGSLLDLFGGEYKFDRWQVKLYNQRGTDRGVSIRYGKNLTDLKQEENCAGCYTGVYPYWSGADGDYLELTEQVVPVAGKFGYSRILTKDFSTEWMEKPTEEQLRTRTQKYISDNNIGVPEVSLKLEFVALEQTQEYKGKAILERVLLGDTVSVEFADMGISTKARVNETRYLPILERYKNVSLGDVRGNFSDIIVNQGKELNKRPDKTAMERAIELLTKALTGAKGGAVRLLDTDGDEMPDTLYIADHPDPAQALKVWRFNYEGWGASKNGYAGPFEMGATFESGIVAEFITAGVLYGMLLKAGAIESDDGKIRIDLDDTSNTAHFNSGIRSNSVQIASPYGGHNLFEIYEDNYGGNNPRFQMCAYTQRGTKLLEAYERVDDNGNGFGIDFNLIGDDGSTFTSITSDIYGGMVWVQGQNESAMLSAQLGESYLLLGAGTGSGLIIGINNRQGAFLSLPNIGRIILDVVDNEDGTYTLIGRDPS